MSNHNVFQVVAMATVRRSRNRLIQDPSPLATILILSRQTGRVAGDGPAGNFFTRMGREPFKSQVE